MRSTFLLISAVALAGCSGQTPIVDASTPVDSGAAPDSGSNCVPPGGSCKTDAGLFQVSLCCSGRCELGSVSTGTCD